MEYIPDRSFPVIVQIRNSLEVMSGLRAATGTLTFSSTAAEVPHVDDTVIVSDGVTSRTYTWVEAAANTAQITIPATATLAAAAFAAAVNVHAPATAIDRVRGITASVLDLVVTLTNTVAGTAGNVAIAGTNNHQTAVGMSGGADGMTVLKTEVVTFTAASATLESLLAGTAYQTGVKRVSIKAAAAWSMNVGAAAAMGTVTLDGGVLYEIGCTADTDLRVIAGGDVAALIVQEG